MLANKRDKQKTKKLWVKTLLNGKGNCDESYGGTTNSFNQCMGEKKFKRIHNPKHAIDVIQNRYIQRKLTLIRKIRRQGKTNLTTLLQELRQMTKTSKRKQQLSRMERQEQIELRRIVEEQARLDSI